MLKRFTRYVTQSVAGMIGISVYVLADADKRAGSLDGQAIRDALLATKDFEGAAGTYNFASNGEMIKDLMVVQIVDGKHTIVPMD